MKGLMEKLIPLLGGVFPDIRERDVLILPNPDVLPGTVKFPCIGITDGTIKVSELSGSVEELTLPVEIYYYDKPKPGNKYILEFLGRREPIRAALKKNRLCGYVRNVSPTKETPVKLMIRERGLIFRKGLFYEYEKEE